MATGFTDPWTPAFQPLERWETKRVAGSFRATASVPVAAAHGGRGPRLPRAVLPWCGRGCAGRGAQLGTSPAAVPTQGSRRGRPGPLAPLWAFPSRPPLAMAFLDTCCPCLPPRWGDGSLPLAAAWHTRGGNDRQCLARPCRRESCLGDLGWPWLASLGHDVPRRPSAPRTSAGCSGGLGAWHAYHWHAPFPSQVQRCRARGASGLREADPLPPWLREFPTVEPCRVHRHPVGSGAVSSHVSRGNCP